MTTSDRELIQRAQQRDAAAFKQLVQRYDNNVMHIALAYGNSRDDAHDIYQEVFLRVYRALPSFRFDSEFSTWLYRITTNACLNYRSRTSKRETVISHFDTELQDCDTAAGSLSDGEFAADRGALQEDIRSSIRSALDYLSPRQRMCFSLKYFREFTVREIAAMLQCSEGSVKRHLYEATQKLRRRLRHLLD